LHGYQEAELVSNRAAVLLFGGTEADRRAWAEEAARAFAGEGPLCEVSQAAALPAALAHLKGVVFVPDLLALGNEAQFQILQCLLHREERPKLVLGLGCALSEALARGQLRDDLSYRLSAGRLDLSVAGLRDAIRARRQQAAKVDKSASRRVAKPVRARKPIVAAKKKRAGKR
jgi:hypothetical protein